VRTTLTLDDDVAKLLEQEMRRKGSSFKQLVNDTLRLGLAAAKHPPRKPFKVKPWNLGLPDFDKVEDLLEYLEGTEHR
jgi:hypothetical protein